MTRRPRWLLWLLLFVTVSLLATCSPAASVPTPSAVVPPTSAPSSTPSPLPTPIPSATPAPTPTLPPPTSAPTPVPADLHLRAEDVIVYPPAGLYSGDLVSFDVLPQDLGPIEAQEIDVALYLGDPDEGTLLAQGQVGYPTLGNDPRARLIWVWDTAGLSGTYTVTAVLDPDDEIQVGDANQANNAAQIELELQPRSQLPPPETGATWASMNTDCCNFYYLTNTAAARDLPEIMQTAEQALATVEARLGYEIEQPFDIYLVGRVVGQGGWASNGLVLSYLDRDYAGGGLDVVLRHEGTHVADRVLGGNAPSILREGLAVYVAGGHFRPEPIPERAAALLALGWYIPLADLADDFYTHQHEVGYLQGAALVAYLVETYGWEAFGDFWAVYQEDSNAPSAALDEALRERFGLGLDEIEQAFVDWLETQDLQPEHVEDLAGTVRYFETMRRYQQLYDPSAYFRDAWLLEPGEAVRRDVVADAIRHPRAPENVALENMLVAADALQDAGDFERADALLDSVDSVLDSGSFDDLLAADYLALTDAVAAAGYEAQRIDLDGNHARVTAIAHWPQTVNLTLCRTEQGWVLAGLAVRVP